MSTGDALSQCAHCGAPSSAPLCTYCGEPRDRYLSIDDQRRALEHYRELLLKAEKEQRTQLLRNGYLPDDAGLLIEAGLECLPMVHHAATVESDEAAARLAAIRTKLRLGPRTPETAQAQAEFGRAIREQRRKGRLWAAAGFAVFGACLVAVILLVRWLVHLIFGGHQ